MHMHPVLTLQCRHSYVDEIIISMLEGLDDDAYDKPGELVDESRDVTCKRSSLEGSEQKKQLEFPVLSPILAQLA